jgi:dTDP-4-amino-4,6-dideoxygalactose transaminase
LNALTYAGHIENLGTAFLSEKLTFVHGNILNAELVDDLARQSTAIAPNHTQPAFKQWHRPLPSTERTGREILTLPLHQHLTEEDVEHVTTELRNAITGAHR